MNRYVLPSLPPCLPPFPPTLLPSPLSFSPSLPPFLPPSLPPSLDSLLQQLYHIPELRAGLLGVDLAEEEEEEEGGEGGREGGRAMQRKDREVLFELQALFALLQTSEKKAADTLPFCQVR